MSHSSAQHRSRSNPPPTHRSQLPTLHHSTRPDGYRKDPLYSPMIPTRGYRETEPVTQSPHISYPTHVISDSGSSDSEMILPDQTKTHSTLKRRPTGKRKSSVTSGITSHTLSTSRHRRRGSGPDDLALLETHILPSLSKTIDRMTNGKVPVPSPTIQDTNDNTMSPPPKSSRLQSRLPTVKQSSQPSTPRPILKSSMRTPTTPTISSFTPTNNSLRSVKSFSPSPRPQGFSDDLNPTFSPTPLLSEKPPSYLSPQAQVPNPSASYHSTLYSSPRRPTISQRASPRPSQDYIRQKSQNRISDYNVEHDSTPHLSPITAERAPWDEVLSEAWHLGNRLSPTPTNSHPGKSTVLPEKEEFHPPDRTFDVHRGSPNNYSGHTPGGDDAALQRKRRETLLAIVEGVNSQFYSGAPDRESSEYSGYMGLAIGSRESAFDEGITGLRRSSGAEQYLQGSGTDRKRSSTSSASRERLSWNERRLTNNSSRINHDTHYAHEESKRFPPTRDPPPKPNTDAQVSRRLSAGNPSETTHAVQVPTPPNYSSQSQREQKRRSVSTPPVVRRSKTDPVQSRKKTESGNTLPRTRSSLFLPTGARVDRPNSGGGLEAFGLPPSLSYIFKDTVGHTGIAPAESGKSLDDPGNGWKGDFDVRKTPEGFLSNGAERLFQALADEDTSGGPNGSSHVPRRFSETFHETPTQARRASMPTIRSDLSIASTPSAPSVYDDLTEEYGGDDKQLSLEPEITQPSAPLALPTWRSTLSPSVYNSFVRLYGEIEMQRQETIFEICRAEALFVQRLRTVLRMFVRPLRAQDSSTWISGVPWSIARLFDWFEDVMNLHVEINTELRYMRSDHQEVVDRFAVVLWKFVPRFEVYQPYMIRLEEVLGQLRGEGDEDADRNWANFREFVSIQELEEDCEGWSLQDLLLEPIHHSSKCMEMFQTLSEKTSKQHVDRLATVSLVSSMKTMFRVMQEVKAREEEYNLIKGLLSAIEGLASLSSLARRERRLLVRGPCQLLVSRSQARSRRNSNGDRQPNILPDPNTKWDKRLEKRRSLLPVSSPDVNPNDFASSASPSKAISGGSTSGYDLVLSPVEVLVFSDVVVMATPTGKGRWKLVDELGIARILNVTECTVVTQGREEHALELHLVPVNNVQLEPTHVDEGIFMSTSVSSVQISVDLEQQRGADRQERWKKWVASLEKCWHSTTLSLKFPLCFDLHREPVGFGGMEIFNADKRQRVMGAGLPPPKSPSTQLLAHGRRQRRRSDFSQSEKEERDWWSFRFKEVYLEMRRDER